MAANQTPVVETEIVKVETFMEILKRGDKRIEEVRAKRIAGALKDEQVALTATLKAKVRKMENDLDRMLDMSVANNSQIVNRIMDLDGHDFVQRYQNIQVELIMARKELEIAETTLTTLFPDIQD